MEGGPVLRRHRRQGTCALWRAVRGISRPRAGLCLLPLLVAKDVENFKNGEISVRFEGLSGRIDQGAGILFNLKPNGDYLALRANCLENNLVLWKFEKGKRSSVSWVRNAPAASKQWHDLKVRINGTKVEGYLDGKLYLEHTLPVSGSGRFGLWQKQTATCTSRTTR